MRKGDRLQGAQLRTRQPTWPTAIAVVKEKEDCYWYKSSGLRRPTLAVRRAEDRVRGSAAYSGGGVIADERGFLRSSVDGGAEDGPDDRVADLGSARTSH